MNIKEKHFMEEKRSMEMTENEKKKEYLKEYERAVRQMERSEERIEELRMSRTSPKAALDGMPRGNRINDLSSYAALLDQEERRYVKARYLRVKKCKEISDRIERLENEDEKDVLVYRYIRLLKWENICEKIGYSWKQVHRIHTKALEHFFI